MARGEAGRAAAARGAGALRVGLDVLRTVLETVAGGRKRIVAMIGHMKGEGDTEGERAEWWQHIGFISMPSEADKTKDDAAKVISYQVNGYEVIISSKDPRGMELAGSMKPGETMIYAPGKDGKGQARTIYKDDGSIHHYTREGNDPDGDGMVIQMDAQAKAIRLLVGGKGIVIDDDGVVVTSGEAALTLGADGSIKLIGTGMCQIDGTNICLGAIAVPVVNGICVGPAGLVAVCSTKCFASLA